MKKEFLPYYLSRGILSIAISMIIFGLKWGALLSAIILFGLFLLYLHSGWFSVDPNQPLSPLRRDERAKEIQRKSLIAAMIVGLLIFTGIPLINSQFGLAIIAGPVPLALGVITYFVTQFILLARI